MVNPAARETGTVSVGISPGSGAPGTQSTVTVTATDSNNQPANISVTLSLTAGGWDVRKRNDDDNCLHWHDRHRHGDAHPRQHTGQQLFHYRHAADWVYIEQSSIGGTPDHHRNPATTATATTLDTGHGCAVSSSPMAGIRAGHRTHRSQTRSSWKLSMPTITPLGIPGSGSGRPSAAARSHRVSSARMPMALRRLRFTPTSTGRIRVVAQVTGVTGNAVFLVQGGDPADALVKVSGDTQNGTPGKALANPFVVEVRDEDGNPLEGHRVSFSVTAGGGSLSETSDVSGANGRAQTTLTLGQRTGGQQCASECSGCGSRDVLHEH